MKVIWKYDIPYDYQFDIDMPAGARILCVGVPAGELCMHAECDTAAPLESRTFKVFYTHSYFEDEGMTYVGSLSIDHYVAHVYEVHRYATEEHIAMELPARATV